MLKILVAVIFAFCWAVIAIQFWPSQSLPVVALKVFFPLLVLVAGIYLFRRARRPASITDTPADPAAQEMIPNTAADSLPVWSYQTPFFAAHTLFGLEEDELADALVSYAVPELDAELVDFAGIALPARRSLAVDGRQEDFARLLNDPEENYLDDVEDLEYGVGEYPAEPVPEWVVPLQYVTPLTRRLVAILSLLVDASADALSQVATYLAEARALTPKAVTSASLSSPGLLDIDTSDPAQGLVKTAPADLAVFQGYPARLKVKLLLPAGFEESLEQIRAVIHAYILSVCDFEPDQLMVETDTAISEPDVRKKFVDGIRQLVEGTSPEMELWLGGATALDQDWIDEQLNSFEGGQKTTMSESGFALLLASRHLHFPAWGPAGRITLFDWAVDAPDMAQMSQKELALHHEGLLEQLAGWMKPAMLAWPEPLQLYSAIDPFNSRMVSGIYRFSQFLEDGMKKEVLLKQPGYLTENNGMLLPVLSVVQAAADLPDATTGPDQPAGKVGLWAPGHRQIVSWHVTPLPAPTPPEEAS